MEESLPKRKILFFIFWTLLLYIIAALIWWFVALNRQNKALIQSQLQQTSITDTVKRAAILKIEQTKTAQYIGEGLTFLLLILIGAFFLYRTIKRTLKNTEQQRHFLMAITHELKTPIAIAKLNIETLQKRTLTKEIEAQLLEKTFEETNRLDVLCNNLLLSSKIDSPGYSTIFENVNFSDLATTCYQAAISRYPKRSISAEIVPNIFVKADIFLLQMLINNLVENAIKYSPKEKLVLVTLSQHNQLAYLRVIDEGSGINELDKKSVFEKFYRLGNEATKKAKGTGLGLYLVKRISQTHDAKITIENNPIGGSIFNFTIKTTS
jgi:two-component system, OmpR family, sensor histidine kinase CiaH